MSEKLANLMAALAELSASELNEFEASVKAKKVEVSEKLSGAKAAFLTELCALIEGLVTPPELCSITLVIDEQGHISTRSYKSGESTKTKVAGSGDGISKGTGVPLPQLGSVYLRTYKGTQHTLLVRGEGDFQLDGKIDCPSANKAYQLATGSTVAMNARRWWFIEGTKQQ